MDIKYVREELEILYAELNAYASLDGRDFNFGTGLIKNEMSYGSEDAYYKMYLEDLEYLIENCDRDNYFLMKKRKSKKDKFYIGKSNYLKWKYLIDYWVEDYFKLDVNKKIKKNNRYLKEKEKLHLKNLKDISWMNVRERDGWNQRFYRGKRSSYLKKQSNKKIRRYKGDLPSKGRTCHKLFDFWWELD